MLSVFKTLLTFQVSTFAVLRVERGEKIQVNLLLAVELFLALNLLLCCMALKLVEGLAVSHGMCRLLSSSVFDGTLVAELRSIRNEPRRSFQASEVLALRANSQPEEVLLSREKVVSCRITAQTFKLVVSQCFGSVSVAGL